MIVAVCEALGITTRISASTDYDDAPGLSQKLLAICQSAGATEYVSGPTARDYLDVELMTTAGVPVTWFDYSGYEEYPQPHGDFTHHVSIVDVLACAGDDGRRLFRARSRQPDALELA
jgi:hypothetical protein